MVRTNDDGWEITRKSGTKFKFNERPLSFPLETEGLLKSFYYGTNRERQLQRGFNSSISSVYDDFNWRFLKAIKKEEDTTFIDAKKDLENSIINRVDKSVLKKTFKELNDKSSSLHIENISLSIFESNAPFESAFLNQLQDNIEIPVSLYILDLFPHLFD
jgi:hypothetical protein